MLCGKCSPGSAGATPWLVKQGFSQPPSLSRMNWEMLAAIGQVAAAIGVIPSLIYLATQIREQNKERRRAAVSVLTGQWSALLKSMIDSSEFADIYLRGLQNFDDLSPAEKIRFG